MVNKETSLQKQSCSVFGGCGAYHAPNTWLTSRDGLGGEELAVIGMELKSFGRSIFACTAHHLFLHLQWDVVVRMLYLMCIC